MQSIKRAVRGKMEKGTRNTSLSVCKIMFTHSKDDKFNNKNTIIMIKVLANKATNT